MSDTNNGAAGQDTAKRLGMAGLAAIVVSSMIGGGIYSQIGRASCRERV